MDSADERGSAVLKLHGNERLLGTRSVSRPFDEAERFEALIASLREKSDQLSKVESPPKQLAREVLSIQRQLIREEAGAGVQGDAIEALYERLWAEPPMQRLFLDLYNKSCAILHSAMSSVEGFDRAIVAADLERIISWYVQRKNTLTALERRGTSDDALLNLAVRHDRSFLGVKGIEISCSLALSGHRFQDLWFKVFLRSGGSFVGVRAGWEHWVDETETLLKIVPVNSSHPVEGARVSAILPVSPASEHCLVDDLRCFIPYAAMDLVAGPHEVMVEAGIYEASGKRLLFVNQSEQISIAEVDDEYPIPSLQSFAVWPVDVATGDSIERLRIRRGHREGNREVLAITYSLELWGHRDEPLKLRCRVLSMQGDPVDGGINSMREGDGSFLYESELTLTSDIARFYDRSLEIPLHALSLDEGQHELFCMLSVVDGSGRTLCGAFERFALNIEGAQLMPPGAEEERSGIPSGSDPSLDLQIGGFLVDAEARFNGTPTIKLGITLASSAWLTKVCRVVMSIEQDPLTTPSTKLRLRPQRQTRCCGGYEGPVRREITAQFSARDIASYLLLPAEGVRLLARVQVYTLDDCLLFNRTRQFVLKQQNVEGSSQVSSFAESASVRVVDLVTKPVVGSSQIKTDVALDVRLDDPQLCRFSVYHEVLDPSGTAVRQQAVQEFETLPGVVLGLDFSDQSFHCRYRAGVFQVRLELSNNLVQFGQSESPRPGIYTLKVLLFSDEGKLIHVVHQPLLVRGRNFPESPLAISYDFDRAVVLDIEEPLTSSPIFETVSAKVRGWLGAVGARHKGR